MKIKKVVFGLLILFGVLCAWFVPIIAKESFDVSAGGIVYAESISDGSRHIGYRIIDTETGVVCFLFDNVELKCLKYK